MADFTGLLQGGFLLHVMAEILAIQSADVKHESQNDSEMKGEEEEEQMSVTLELSSDRRDTIYRENYNTSKSLPAEVFLQQDNMHVMAEILAIQSADVKHESQNDSEMKGEEEEEQWSIAKGHNLYGSEKLQTLYVAWTIGKLLRKIPTELMHRKWPSVFPDFKKELEQPNTSWTKLRELLLRLECGMRRTLFLPQWWNNLGHTRLTRTTVEDRERMMKEAQRRKKEEREAIDAVDEDIIIVKHTKLPHGVSKELTRMRS
ncbi:hypothetical protein ANCCEY_03599 [Ancylostoma ceylanicum]|uniref:Uncharacterized protein n=1 Tax=Ancylostoma ceylanicum TaxID=53326 RepID=A0A0D6MB06_9BILA|nr:hypothetical protein ANCCEY_03599 [Ancylostoma ceylanicum]